jgi:hypothetical protein
VSALLIDFAITNGLRTDTKNCETLFSSMRKQRGPLREPCSRFACYCWFIQGASGWTMLAVRHSSELSKRLAASNIVWGILNVAGRRGSVSHQAQIVRPAEIFRIDNITLPPQ